MASCTFHRVDSLNTTNTTGKHASRLIYVASEAKIFVAWKESGSIRFAKYDPVTHTASGEVDVYGAGVGLGLSAPDMIRFTNGDLMITFYSTDGTNSTYSCLSTDSGATWGSRVQVGLINEYPAGLYSDGTTVWQLMVAIGGGGTGGTADVIRRVYSAGVWGAGLNVYNSGGTGGTPGGWAVQQVEQAHLALYMSSSTVGFIVGWRGTDGGSNTRRLSCLPTADGWASELSASAVDLATFTASGGGTGLQLLAVGTRVYLLAHDPDNSGKMRIYYTDNNGAAWTTLGVPTVYQTWLTDNSVTGDGSFDSFLCSDEMDNILFGQSTQAQLSPNGKHSTFRSVDPTDIADYVLAGECNYNTTVDALSSVMTGRGIIVGDTLHRAVTVVRDFGAGNRYTLEFLAVEGAGIPEEPPEPPTPPPAIQSGADDNNQMWRIDLAEGRGWSLHLMPPSCFLIWHEGDAETGREVDILLMGNPSMDPAIQDPSLIWGFRRFESNFEGYGWRSFVSDGTNIHTVNDPMRLYIRSKEFLVKGEGDRNVARQAYFSYLFDAPEGEVLPVQVWVDRKKQNRTIDLPTTFGEKTEEWFSLPTPLNVGSVVQFVIDELSNYPVSFDALGLSYIPKGRRS